MIKKFGISFLGALILALVFSWTLNSRIKDRFDSTKKLSPVLAFLNQLEVNWYDFKFRIKTAEHSNDVLVAEIDNDSLNSFGRWPWARYIVRDVLREIYRFGAQTVALDVVFSDPEYNDEDLNYNLKSMPYLNGNNLKDVVGLNDEQTQKLVRGLREVGDLALSGFVSAAQFNESSIDQTSSNQIGSVLGYVWENDCEIYADEAVSAEHPASISGGTYIEQISNIVAHAIFVEGFPAIQNSQQAVFPSYPCVISNRSTLEIASFRGSFNAKGDEDGVFRRIPMLMAFNAAYLLDSKKVATDDLEWVNPKATQSLALFPSLALSAVLSYYTSIDGERPKIEVDVERSQDSRLFLKQLQILRSNSKSLIIPLLPDGSVGVRFLGSQMDRPFAIPKFSVAHMSSHLKSLSSVYELDKELPLKNKLVLFGPTALGVYDLRPNPVQKDAGGVYLHANMAARIVEAFDKGTNPTMSYASVQTNVSLLLLIVFLVSLSTMGVGGFKGIWFYLIILSAGLYVDIYFFEKQGLVIETFTILIASLSTMILLLAYKYFTEEQDRAFVKGAFEKYVSPDLVDSILADPKKLNLGGEKRELSVMFSDIRGFTNISEKMGASELAKFMNDYLTPMTEIILEDKGTIDKYMGDAIMAIFGAPVSYANHAHQAVYAALRMLEKLDQLKLLWKEQGLPAIEIGIGVNTGDMSVGNMGSTRIFSYTVMGDSVNLGSRLEGLTKEYGVRLIVSEFTHAQLGQEFVCRQLDRVKVKGKNKPVTIYEVMGLASHPKAQEWKTLADSFEQALNHYYQSQFVEAQKLFQELAQKNDLTSEIYSERCALWLETPPETGWDGSWTMKTK